jgi:hypothetical protein
MIILGLLRLKFSSSIDFKFNVNAWTQYHILKCAFRLQAALIVMGVKICGIYPTQLWLKDRAFSYGNKIKSCTNKWIVCHIK